MFGFYHLVSTCGGRKREQILFFQFPEPPGQSASTLDGRVPEFTLFLWMVAEKHDLGFGKSTQQQTLPSNTGGHQAPLDGVLAVSATGEGSTR